MKPTVEALLRLPTVLARTGLSRSAVYERIGRGMFPRSVSLGGQSVAWIQSEVDTWIAQRITEARSTPSVPTRKTARPKSQALKVVGG